MIYSKEHQPQIFTKPEIKTAGIGRIANFK